MRRTASSSVTGFVVLAAILFFGSGACALVYQVLWTRMLGLVFGVTVYAASAVFAAFMAGLAIGSYAAGRVGDRIRHPFAWFGAIEILIGVTAIVTPLGLTALQSAYAAAYPWLPHSLPALTAVRLLLAFVLLVVPTALMGTTLPLVVRGSDFRTGMLSGAVSVLYGSNAAGAIVGTLLAGLWLIPTRGIRGTFMAAAMANVLVGLGAIAFSRMTAAAGRVQEGVEAPAVPTPGATNAAAVMDAVRDRRLRLVLAVFGISGIVSMALEVVWFRVLTLFLRPTVYGFSVMLAMVLFGIALGSYVVGPWLTRRWRWLLLLALLEMAIGTATAMSFQLLGRLGPLSESIGPLVARLLPEYLAYPLAGSLLAIFPTALLMGVAFPIGLFIWTGTGSGQSGQSARRVSLFYSLNVGGGIAGSLLGGFVLLPGLGSHVSLLFLAGISFLSGIALLSVAEVPRLGRLLVGLCGTLVFAFAVWASPNPFVEFIRQRYPGHEIVWQREGVDTTVVVHRGEGLLNLTVNGIHEASNGEVMAYIHRRIGHLPMALHPNARTALVIGLGGGATAGAVSIHHDVAVDVVELSTGVIAGARFFDSINYGVLDRPNVTLRVDDGRNYLMLTPRRYDVVTADIIIPIYAGSGNLYSADYFKQMRRVLNPGGIAMQWVDGTEAEYKTIVRTFLSVFPNTTAWVGGGLLVGSMEPLRLSRRAFMSKMAYPGDMQALRDLNVTSFEALMAAFTAGPNELRAFVGDGPLLTDDRPLAEYFLSLPRETYPDFSRLKGDVNAHVVD